MLFEVLYTVEENYYSTLRSKAFSDKWNNINDSDRIKQVNDVRRVTSEKPKGPE